MERGHSGPEGSDELKGSWWQGWRIDIDGYVEWGGWRGERGREREAGIHFVGGGVADGGMGSGIVCIAYALGVEGPLQILGGVQESHAAIPVPPPTFQFSVAARVMTKRGCPGGAESRVDRGHQMGEEFGGSITVEDVGGAATKVQFV